MKKRVLSMLVALTMILSLVPAVSVSAEECTHHTKHTEGICYTVEDTQSITPAEFDASLGEYECAVCPVQKMINDLPEAAELPDLDTDEKNDVYEELLAADEAYQALSEEEKEYLTEENAKLDELFAYFAEMVSPAADTPAYAESYKNIAEYLYVNGEAVVDLHGENKVIPYTTETPHYAADGTTVMWTSRFDSNADHIISIQADQTWDKVTTIKGWTGRRTEDYASNLSGVIVGYANYSNNCSIPYSLVGKDGTGSLSYSTRCDVKIELNGKTLKIEAPDMTGVNTTLLHDAAGIMLADGSLEIVGPGKLIVTGPKVDHGRSSAIGNPSAETKPGSSTYNGMGLTINKGAEVTATAQAPAVGESYGVYVGSYLTIDGEGTSLTAKGADLSKKNTELTDSGGVYSGYYMQVTNGASLTGEGGDAPNGSSYGVNIKGTATDHNDTLLVGVNYTNRTNRETFTAAENKATLTGIGGNAKTYSYGIKNAKGALINGDVYAEGGNVTEGSSYGADLNELRTSGTNSTSKYYPFLLGGSFLAKSGEVAEGAEDSQSQAITVPFEENFTLYSMKSKPSGYYERWTLVLSEKADGSNPTSLYNAPYLRGVTDMLKDYKWAAIAPGYNLAVNGKGVYDDAEFPDGTKIEGNLDDILGDGTAELRFEDEKAVLALDGLTVNEPSEQWSSGARGFQADTTAYSESHLYKAGIINQMGKELEIELTGENTVTSDDVTTRDTANTSLDFTAGIYATNNITFTGDGELTVTGGNISGGNGSDIGLSCGIYLDTDEEHALTIESGTVKVYGGNTSTTVGGTSFGIRSGAYLRQGVGFGSLAQVIVNGGELYAQSGKSIGSGGTIQTFAYGIGGNTTVNDGVVEAAIIGGWSDELSKVTSGPVYSAMTINGGEVTLWNVDTNMESNNPTTITSLTPPNLTNYEGNYYAVASESQGTFTDGVWTAAPKDIVPFDETVTGSAKYKYFHVEPAYPVWISGTILTDSNIEILLGEGSSIEESDEGYVLTLKDEIISGGNVTGGKAPADTVNAGIYAVEPLTIVLEGTNTVSGDMAVYSTSTITIAQAEDAEGTLIANGTKTGISAADGITIDEGFDYFWRESKDGTYNTGRKDGFTGSDSAYVEFYPSIGDPVITPDVASIDVTNTVTITKAADDTETGITIYYTTDGTDPTAENGTEYTAPFKIEEGTTTIKAIAVYNGGESKISKKEYKVTATRELSVEDIIFDAIEEGAAQPAAKTIAIKNTGTGPVTIGSVKSDSENFIINDAEAQTVAPGETTTNWTVQPKAGLTKGDYEATITINYLEGASGATKTFKVSISVSDEIFAITAATDGNGSISPTTVNVAKGSSYEFAITPNENYEIAGVTVDGKAADFDAKNNTFTLANVQANHAINVTFKQTIIYHTVSFDANTGSGSMEGVTVPEGNYTLPASTFTPPENKYFSGWAIGAMDGEIQKAGSSYNVTKDIVLYAVWSDIPAETYTVTVEGSYAGSESNGSGSYAGGETVNIKAGTNSGYEFTGWTSDDVTITNASSADASFTMPNHNVTVKANWTYTESGTISGGGSSSSSSSSSTTVTNKGDSTEVNTSSGTISESNADKAVDKAKENGSDTIVIDTNKEKVTLPAGMTENIADQTDADLVVETKNGTVTIPNSTLADLDAEGKVTVEVTKDKVTISDEDGKLSNIGKVEVTVPYEENSKTGNVAVEVTKADGTKEVIEDVYDGKDSVTFEVDGSVTFEIIDDYVPVVPEQPAENPFKDVSEKDWFYKAVMYVYTNGLMSGVDADNFGPSWNTTRGMITTILWRMEGKPEAGEAPFKDVKADMYYAEAIAWAAENGIVSGYGDTFGPDDNITREQLASILFRYAKFKGYDVSAGENTNILSYNDAFDISEYAIPAMQWACGAGIISGNDNGTLNPAGHAQRAHAAQMLMKFDTNVK